MIVLLFFANQVFCHHLPMCSSCFLMLISNACSLDRAFVLHASNDKHTFLPLVMNYMPFWNVEAMNYEI